MPDPTIAGVGVDAAKMKVHVLDMGKTKYGDCIIVEIGRIRVLIDGGHPGDYEDRSGQKGIPSQISSILNAEAPFHFDLLVVTHCHSDHIGCLPRLIRDGIVTAEWALVADEFLGFGRTAGGGDAQLFSGLTPQMRTAIAAIGEEGGPGFANDSELIEFLEDAASLEDNYKEMLASLATNGANVVRYGRDDHSTLAAQFAQHGMKILGPTVDHLLICADVIRQGTEDAASLLRDLASDDDSPNDAATWYRLLMQSEVDAADMPGIGAAKNNQSIVLSFSDGNSKTLLTGDMQFAKAEVSDLVEIMDELRATVVASGPFDLVKTPHHSSYNGIDSTVIDAFGAKTLVHSGGWNDPGHPSGKVLQLLRQKRQELTWARTDKNGQINASFQSGNVDLEIARGQLNNAAANRPADTPTAVRVNLPAAVPVAQPRVNAVPPALHNPEVAVVGNDAPSDFVEVTARIPHTTTKVVLTVDVIRSAEEKVGAGKRAVADGRAWYIGGGRELPTLLFVTNRDRLRTNIGSSAAEDVMDAIIRSGHRVLDDVSSDIESAGKRVAAELQQIGSNGVAGVVLIGGYDVVPAQRLDVLPTALRGRLRDPDSEPDQYIVWSDDVYGTPDSDSIPDFPVSRIPDGRSAVLVKNALTTGGHVEETRFAVRNFARPFAGDVFNKMKGRGGLEVSESFSPAQLAARPELLNANSVYLMLHGADSDGTRFWGETQDEQIYEAVNHGSIPDPCSATVFTGCCWGAMPVHRRASEVSSSANAGPRTPKDSIALTFLERGARAFVGCTGVHYSPTTPPYGFFGGPMHDLFWKRLADSGKPALALFEAKNDYLLGIPHQRNGSPAALAQNEAIELKIMRQYTCLGLGW